MGAVGRRGQADGQGRAEVGSGASSTAAEPSVPGRRSGAWVFRDTRMPVAAVFKNLEAGSDIEEIVEQFHVSREQIQAVLEFAARSLDAPPEPMGGPVSAFSLTTAPLPG